MGARLGEPHRPAGTGNVKRSVDARGLVSFQGRVTRDGLVYWSKAVSCRKLPTGKRLSETAAKRLAEANLRKLLDDLGEGRTPDPAKERIRLEDFATLWRRAKADSLPADTPSWRTYSLTLDQWRALSQYRPIRPARSGYQSRPGGSSASWSAVGPRLLPRPGQADPTDACSRPTPK